MSETFAPDWLALREPADHAARSRTVLDRLVTWARGRGPLTVADLGAGTGSNLRYLGPELPNRQHWLLMDHDAALLYGVRPSSRHVTLETEQRNLARANELSQITADLLTGSALLDLVSEAWLCRLADRCAALGAAAAFALNYDGRIDWTPALPDDDSLRLSVNAHQRRDKGFGPALGPTAGDVAARVFQARGFRTALEPSPWVLTEDDSALQLALLEGWVAAAEEQQPLLLERRQQWAEQRRRLISSGESRLLVGHLDLLALPPSP